MSGIFMQIQKKEKKHLLQAKSLKSTPVKMGNNTVHNMMQEMMHKKMLIKMDFPVQAIHVTLDCSDIFLSLKGTLPLTLVCPNLYYQHMS
jgi:hypothetical protein